MGHVGYMQTYQRLSQGLYICHMTKLLRKYLHHCLQCQVQMTPRHSLYRSLQPIISLLRPFYIIIIDFILALLLSSKGFDSAMLVTDKYSKQVTLIAGKIAWGAKKWAIKLFNQLNRVNWGLPSTNPLRPQQAICCKALGSHFWKVESGPALLNIVPCADQ